VINKLAISGMRRMEMGMKKARLAIVLAVACTLAAAADAAPAAGTVVAGMVFCDQCKDGARGLFDYPLYGG
jgi:hypothetical protein